MKYCELCRIKIKYSDIFSVYYKFLNKDFLFVCNKCNNVYMVNNFILRVLQLQVFILPPVVVLVINLFLKNPILAINFSTSLYYENFYKVKKEVKHEYYNRPNFEF